MNVIIASAFASRWMCPCAKKMVVAPLDESTVTQGQILFTCVFIERIDGRSFLRYWALLLVSKILREDVINVLVSPT